MYVKMKTKLVFLQMHKHEINFTRLSFNFLLVGSLKRFIKVKHKISYFNIVLFGLFDFFLVETLQDE